MAGGANATAIGCLGGTGLLNNGNSNIVAESELLDIEFGYCSEEESIFQSFS
jgi:hypothetical protein